VKKTKETKESVKIKCPDCHAYFVDEGELCSNCQAKQDENEEKDEEEE